MATKLVVLGIPWDVDTEGLRQYMSKFGELDDCIVMKERSTGRSRGFGYATFSSADDAKDQGSKGHRGIGFITFESADSVDTLMAESHELGGSTIVVDRATPKEEDVKFPSRVMQGGYGAYNAYITAATRYAALGAPTLYDNPGSSYGRGFFQQPRGMGKKIFVGRLPQEASAEDLREYFGRFGRILDVYVPKDPKRTGHRGFGFVTFAEEGVADRVSRRTHEILGHEVAIDSATPLDEGAAGSYMDAAEAYGGYGGPVRNYGRLYGSLDFDDYGYGASASNRPPRMDFRYRPY